MLVASELVVEVLVPIARVLCKRLYILYVYGFKELSAKLEVSQLAPLCDRVIVGGDGTLFVGVAESDEVGRRTSEHELQDGRPVDAHAREQALRLLHVQL